METIFTFLFKYRPILFEEGAVVFNSPWPALMVIGAAVTVGAAAVVTYGGEKGRSTPVDRGILAALRLSALAVLAFTLLQPTLVLTSVVAQRNFVGILLDDSRSMQLPAEDGGSRADYIRETFGSEGSELVDALAERFSLRYFRFSSETSRVGSADELGFNGTRTDLSDGLSRARAELASVPLSGLVVLTDGADNGGTPLAETLVPLQAASVPVYTVGLGEEALRPDLQIGRIEVPETVLQGSSLVIDAVVTQRGYRGRSVEVIVEDGNRRIAQETVELAGDGDPVVAPIRLTLEDPGPRRLRFSIERQEDEAVVENNAREIIVDVRARREKVLYFEGEPRFELKFVRRAMEDDLNMQVVVLQRTAPGKFLRLAVDDGEELAGGFPRTREELFEYRALIIGSVEASFFTADQLSMIADFASRRGGGVLFLGGRLAFAEGGYAGTAIEDALPVFLEDPAPDPRAAFVELQVEPTNAGLAHPISQILPSDVEEAEVPVPGANGVPVPTNLDDAWATLPPLSTMNRIVRAKPGATTLLTGDVDGEERIVLAWHRFGRGKVIALPVQDTWMWQMHHEIAVDDPRHELLWQQLLRWLVDAVPDRVTASTDRERVEPGEVIQLRASVVDSAHIEVNSAEVRALITDPIGTEFTETLSWTIDENGLYTADWTPEIGGQHSVQILATADAGVDTLGASVAFFQVGPSDDEYFDAGRRTNLLTRLAEDTGGRFYTVNDVDRLPEDLRFTGAGVTLTEERDLWDMPIFFLLLIGLIGAEWGYRRMRGLV